MFGPQPLPLLGIRTLVVGNSREVAHISIHLGTSLSTVCFFGCEKLRLEMTAAFQVHNGRMSSDAKSDICQSDTMARRGTHARQPLITSHVRFLGIFAAESAWMLAETSLYSGWCITVLTDKSPLTGSLCHLQVTYSLCQTVNTPVWASRARSPGRTHPGL